MKIWGVSAHYHDAAAALVGRLGSRGTDPPEVVRRRLRNAAEEVRAAPEFDYVVLNEVLQTAVGELEDVLRGRAGPRGVGEGLEARIEAVRAGIERELGREGCG